MISLSDYAQVFNKCCLVYLGNSPIVLEEIIKNKNFLELLYKNIKISICANDDLAKKYENIIKKSELKHYKNKFGYVREVNGPIN